MDENRHGNVSCCGVACLRVWRQYCCSDEAHEAQTFRVSGDPRGLAVQDADFQRMKSRTQRRRFRIPIPRFSFSVLGQPYLRADPLERVKTKVTVKNAVCCNWKTRVYGVFDWEFDFHSHEWSCSNNHSTKKEHPTISSSIPPPPPSPRCPNELRDTRVYYYVLPEATLSVER